MKMRIAVIIVVLGLAGLGAYKVIDVIQRDEVVKAEVTVPVTLKEIKEENMEEGLDYEGRVTPDSIEKISFKTTARLSAFNADVGQTLDAGTILASLDQSDLQLALDAAESQLIAATAEYQRANKGARVEDIELAKLTSEKAAMAVDYLSKKVVDLQSLVDEGIATQSDLDGLKLELDLAYKDQELALKNYEKATNGAEVEVIKAAKAQVAMATTNKDSKLLMIEDSTYTLKEKSTLVEQFYEVGELVPAGYPVAVLRSEKVKVLLGVTVNDLAKVYLGQAVHILSTNSSTTGEVIRIAEIPDESHFLYEIEVAIADNTFKIGEIVKCKLSLGEKDVIKVPISAIMNDGIDYVYLAKEGVATIHKIEILGVDEGYAIVSGLSIGDTIIVSNLNRIHEQSKILVEE